MFPPFPDPEIRTDGAPSAVPPRNPPGPPAAPGGLAPALAAALARGATVVTPNNRLARRLVQLHDAGEVAAGRRAWTVPRVLPWAAFAATLWRDGVAAGFLDAAPRLLSPLQAGLLWRRVVATDWSVAAPLADAAGAAELAADAWERMHAFGAGGESWRSWSGGLLGDDAAMFARWAEAYMRALRERHAIDPAQAVDRLLRGQPCWADFVATDLVFAGFVELTPQQQRLTAALRSGGIGVEVLDTLPARAGDVRVVPCATPRDEIVAALHWARDRVAKDPGAAVCIAVVDLAERRDEVRAAAEDVLCPALQWPGRHDAARPYDLSLGTALADQPGIAAALDLIALSDAPLPVARAARLLRSPFLPGDRAAWLRRAALERQWLADGRETVDADALLRGLADADTALADRMAAARTVSLPRSRASPRAWCNGWRAWLSALGWPGDSVQDSAVHQALGAWDELLAALSALDAISGHLARREAVAMLAAVAATTLFQPEGPAAPIRIMGVLEAAGLPQDALWVAGLGADAWPPAARPNPLLPLAWQRERQLPRASARREFDYAATLTGWLARGAPEVVMSHPEVVDDHASAASALLDGWPGGAAVPVLPGLAASMFAVRPALELIADFAAPPLAAGTQLRGGAGVFEAQSDCPFRAAAAYRLEVEPWPRVGFGLTALERGQLAHLALAAFWRRIGDRRTLVALDAAALDAAIGAAVDAALAGEAVDERRWRSLPPPIVAGERTRLVAMLATWIERAERPRPDFTVVEIEAAGALTLPVFTVRVRLDRIDRLEDGSIAIIDYKTGRCAATRRWFDERPQAPQLGVYVVARCTADPATPIGAVAYARMAPDRLDWQGLAADASLLPPLAEPAAATGGLVPDWPAAQVAWRRAIEGLAGEIARGHAVVAPRAPPLTCRRCGLGSLCRIGNVTDEAPDEVADDD